MAHVERPPGSPLRNEAGMNIIEVYIVLGILGLVALAILATVGTIVPETQVRGATEQLAGLLREARQDAIASGANYRVTVSAAQIQVGCTDGVPVGNVCPTPRPPNRTEPVIGGVTLSPSASPVNFAPNGGATASTVTVSLSGATSRQVQIRVSGSVRVCAPSCS